MGRIVNDKKYFNKNKDSTKLDLMSMEIDNMNCIEFKLICCKVYPLIWVLVVKLAAQYATNFHETVIFFSFIQCVLNKM